MQQQVDNQKLTVDVLTGDVIDRRRDLGEVGGQFGGPVHVEADPDDHRNVARGRPVRFGEDAGELAVVKAEVEGMLKKVKAQLPPAR